jgi:hypothetical protein
MVYYQIFMDLYFILMLFLFLFRDYVHFRFIIRFLFFIRLYLYKLEVLMIDNNLMRKYLFEVFLDFIIIFFMVVVSYFHQIKCIK